MRLSQLEQLLDECDLAGDDRAALAAGLAPLRDLATRAPAPGGDLLALFGEAPEDAETPPGATEPDGQDGQPPGPRPASVVVPLPVRARRLVVGVVVLAVSGVGATGLSAAANTLPEGWQRHVSDFAHHHLPFDLPAPRSRDEVPLSTTPAPHGRRLDPPARPADPVSGAAQLAPPTSYVDPRPAAAEAPSDHERGLLRHPRPSSATPAASEPASADNSTPAPSATSSPRPRGPGEGPASSSPGPTGPGGQPGGQSGGGQSGGGQSGGGQSGGGQSGRPAGSSSPRPRPVPGDPEAVPPGLVAPVAPTAPPEAVEQGDVSDGGSGEAGDAVGGRGSHRGEGRGPGRPEGPASRAVNAG